MGGLTFILAYLEKSKLITKLLLSLFNNIVTLIFIWKEDKLLKY